MFRYFAFPLFFQKNRILSGILMPSLVFMTKEGAGSPFRILWNAKKRDDQRVFSQYYLPCHKKITMYCLGLLKDIELAENAATDALLTLFKASVDENIKNPEAWLFSVAKNKCLNLLSQKKRRREILDQLKPNLEKTAPAKGDQKIVAEELAQKIKRILNDKEWMIWDLHQQGFDNREIAKRLESTEKTVANLKSLARNKLRAALRPNPSEK